MDQEALNKLAQKTSDPNSFGKDLESQKETVVSETNKQSAYAKKAKKDREERRQKKVGIKTYRDYAAAELRKGGGTLTKMIIQEREKEREQKRHSVKNTKNVAITVLSGLFVLAGIGIVVLSFFLVSQKQEEAQERRSFVVAPEPLIISDFRKEIYIPSPTRTKIIRDVREDIDETTIPIGSIKHVYFVQDGSTETKELISTQDFLQHIQANVPSSLSRNLDPVFMYGFYSSTDVSPFLMFTVSSFSTAYSGLLEWEQDIIRDFEDLFTQDLGNTSRTGFQDIVLFNTDVRAILDSEGEVIFGYAFLQDKETLLLFDNRLTLREVITRAQRNTIRQ